MKKLFFLSIVLFAVVYMSSCDGNEDDSGIEIIMPVDSTDATVATPK